MKKDEKTNAVRKLDAMKLSYELLSYETHEALSGEEVARSLGLDPAMVFKTLVTVGKSGGHYVFMIPVQKELDLKKAAAACGEKSVSMLKSKELLPLTGYIHGGCSPVGMKKLFPTFIDASAKEQPVLYCSAGKIGLQMKLPLAELQKVIPLTLACLTRQESIHENESGGQSSCLNT